ncbi:MAG: discoidin domain-containing protein [Eisenbergiella sp.]
MRKTFKIGGVVLLAVLLLVAVFGLRDDLIKETQRMRPGDLSGESGPAAGGEVTADGVENEKFGASLAVDGNRRDRASRWSSANEAGQPEHWLMVEFPEERSVSFVRLYWERLNVEGFVLEASEDGENWVQAADWEGEQEANAQSIVLDKVVNGRFFRIRTTAVSTAEENQYLYYQNVSLLEMELYEEVPLVYCLEVPEIQGKEDGSRYLPLPVVPEGYEISFIGADYEEIIGEDGTVYPLWRKKMLRWGIGCHGTGNMRILRRIQ